MIPSVFAGSQPIPANESLGASHLFRCFAEDRLQPSHWFCVHLLKISLLNSESISVACNPRTLAVMPVLFHCKAGILETPSSDPLTPSGILHLTSASLFSPKLTSEVVIPKPSGVTPKGWRKFSWLLSKYHWGILWAMWHCETMEIISPKLTMSKWKSKDVKGLVKKRQWHSMMDWLLAQVLSAKTLINLCGVGDGLWRRLGLWT